VDEPRLQKKRLCRLRKSKEDENQTSAGEREGSLKLVSNVKKEENCGFYRGTELLHTLNSDGYRRILKGQEASLLQEIWPEGGGGKKTI